MELNEQQKEEFLKTFITNIETALKNLKSKKENKSATEVLKEQGSSDKEKEIIKDLCDEIDSFHQKKKILQESKAEDPTCTENQWLKEEIITSANEVYKAKKNCDLSQEMQDELSLYDKKELVKAIDSLITQITENKKE